MYSDASTCVVIRYAKHKILHAMSDVSGMLLSQGQIDWSDALLDDYVGGFLVSCARVVSLKQAV